MFEITQLVQRIDQHQPVTVEEYLACLVFENQNHDVGSCVCGARGGLLAEQHMVECRRASIMVLPDWLQIFRQREKDFEPCGMGE